MAITGVSFERFTAFERLRIDLTPGINVFIGANGTGKTHILKTIYSACDITKTHGNFAEKLVEVFLPSRRSIGRLVKRRNTSARGAVEVDGNGRRIRVSFSNHSETATNAKITGGRDWASDAIECAYIPVKEMLSNAPGFRSLYKHRSIHFDETYADILDRANLPVLRGPVSKERRKLLTHLEKAISGKVIIRNEEFFLKSKQGNLEFTLLAEGHRKLGLIWMLIQNGTLGRGSVLFWDEPEANLNPAVAQTLIYILMELQRQGVQILLATHDYTVLKEIDLQAKKTDSILYHALFRDTAGTVRCNSVDTLSRLEPNAIVQAFANLFDRDVGRSFKDLR